MSAAWATLALVIFMLFALWYVPLAARRIARENEQLDQERFGWITAHTEWRWSEPRRRGARETDQEGDSWISSEHPPNSKRGC